MLSHRVAWWLATGTWPLPHQRVCHICDTPACVRNDDQGTYTINGRILPRVGHLFLGDDAANLADAAAKGRMHPGDAHGLRRHPERVARGERNGSAKLTVPDVRAIRTRFAAGDASQHALAREYGVSVATICRLINRHIWADVE
jgi:hypothetical protein